MNAKRWGCVLLLAAAMGGMAGCRRVRGSEIVQKFKAAGGGDPVLARAPQIGAWFAKQDAARLELNPLCQAKKKEATADWPNTDEGKVCAGLALANFFGRSKVVGDGYKF